MRTFEKDMELLSLIGLTDRTGRYLQLEDQLHFGRDAVTVQVRAEDGGRLSEAQAYTLRTFGELDGRALKLEFTATDARDIFALVMHLSYMAAYRNTSPTVREEQVSFVFNDERVVLPFFKEDECSWIGFKQGRTIVLEHPASHYGDNYLKWRDQVVEWAKDFVSACRPETTKAPQMGL